MDISEIKSNKDELSSSFSQHSININSMLTENKLRRLQPDNKTNKKRLCRITTLEQTIPL